MVPLHVAFLPDNAANLLHLPLMNSVTSIAAKSADTSRGILLVAGSALVWSFGGTIARFLETTDSWTIVFWRSFFAAVFLFGFMLWRDGPRGTLAMFKGMGIPGLGVAACFAIASTSFVVALKHTTVANILLMQAGVPLIAALLAWALFRERVSAATWGAIAAVITGVAVMVSDSFGGKVSPIGDGLALLIAFATGARLVPAALTALIGTLEPISGPIWVWLVHEEVPTTRTLAGGLIVFTALVAHLLMEWQRQNR